MKVLTLLTGVFMVVGSGTSPQQKETQPRFRTGTLQVSVNVSVRAGNNPVGGLAAADFILTDNGVPQTIAELSFEAVPIDVTLILDTSGSTYGAASQVVRDAQEISTLIRPIDRFRLLTIDTYVNQIQPLEPAGTRMSFDNLRLNGSTAAYDALAAAMIFRVEPGRRHLIVAITDARDTISALDAAAVRDIAARSDAVLHIAILDVVSSNPPQQLRQWTNHLQLEPETLRDAARRTGGELHEPGIFGTRTVNIFKKVFEDFRRSYVLHYTPTGVAPGGWHELDVKVTRRARYEVRARKGYYAD